jgi:hypothetical protein
MEQETAEISKKREKSVKYPYYSLDECLEFAGTINKIAGRGEALTSSVLKALNITTETNKQYKYKLSSASQFGLIERTAAGLKITELTRRILYPPEGESQKRCLIIEAFKSPPLYQKLIQRYANLVLPEHIPNVLLDMGIATNAKEHAAKIFEISARVAGVLGDDSILRVGETGASNINNSVVADTATTDRCGRASVDVMPPTVPSAKSPPLQKASSDSYVLTIVGPGLNLTLEIKDAQDLPHAESLISFLKNKLGQS